MMVSDDAVACRHGEIDLVMIGNEYLRTISLARVVRDDDNAPLVYMLSSEACASTKSLDNSMAAFDNATYVGR